MVVDIAAVAQGVIGSQCGGHAAGGRQQASPCVVGVANHLLAAGVDNGNHIALQIGGVVIGGVIVNHRQRISVGIIVEMQDFVANGHMRQLAAVVEVVIGGCAVGTLGAHAVGVIGKVPGGAAFGHAGKLPAVDPCIVPCAVRQRITDGIIGDAFAIVGCQQVTPLRIALDIIDSTYNCAQRAGGIGIGLFAGNITGVVVGPHPSPARGLVILPDQLIGAIVGIGFRKGGQTSCPLSINLNSIIRFQNAQYTYLRESHNYTV